MANDRLYLVNVTDGYYMCIAKSFGTWDLGNVNLLFEFLGYCSEFDEIVLRKESDNDISWMDTMENFNETGRWEYYERKSDTDETH